jgi:hypothetical protein
MDQQSFARRLLSSSLAIPFLIAAAQFVLQVLFHGSYGYFRDELYYIACSKHLAFGYVDQPPLSLLILAISRWVLGDSLQAIRLLPSLAGAAVVMIAALTARRLGGGRFAQGLASLSVVAAHVLLGAGRYFSMNAFDVLFWALALYIVVRIFVEEQPQLWIWFGVVVGLGLLNKYSVGFLCVGLVGGMILTSARKEIASRWFWIGVLIAALLFLPHVIWEVKNDLPSIEFMRNASQQKNVPTSFSDFLVGQFREVNFLNAPLWLLGLYYFFFNPDAKRLRWLGWFYVILFVIFVMGNGKAYYLSPVYPVLLAGGSVMLEQFLQTRSLGWIKPVYIGLLIAFTLAVSPFALPVLPIGRFIEYQNALGIAPKADEHSALGVLPQGYADQFGWEDFAATVSKIYQTLTPEEQSKCVVFVRNYGEAGAIDFFGKKYGLPDALCAHNSYWYWGPGEKTGDVAIILGSRRDLQENLDDLKRAYDSVEPSLKTSCDLCMPYENERQFFICRGMKTTFQKIWARERFFI